MERRYYEGTAPAAKRSTNRIDTASSGASNVRLPENFFCRYHSYIFRGSISDIRLLLQKNNLVLEQVAQRTMSLRKSFPRVKAPPSIFDGSIGDEKSIYSFAESTATSTDFAFDDVVVNSHAYRRALAASRSNMQPINEQVEENSDSSTLVGVGSVSRSVQSRPEIPSDILEKAARCDEIEQMMQKMGAELTQEREEHARLTDKYHELESQYYDRAQRFDKLRKVYIEKEAEFKELKNTAEVDFKELKDTVEGYTTTIEKLQAEVLALKTAKEHLQMLVQHGEQIAEKSKTDFERLEEIIETMSMLEHP